VAAGLAKRLECVPRKRSGLPLSNAKSARKRPRAGVP